MSEATKTAVKFTPDETAKAALAVWSDAVLRASRGTESDRLIGEALQSIVFIARTAGGINGLRAALAFFGRELTEAGR